MRGIFHNYVEYVNFILRKAFSIYRKQMDSRFSVELITGVIKQWKMAEIVTSKAY